jgi:lipoate-protein ligase A
MDGAADGAWNMAVDEALLDAVARGEAPVLRLYRWDAPTVSLGYFQSYEDRREHPASLSCPVVRRASGGGAIIHDQELTYSLAIACGGRLSSDHRHLCHVVHSALVDALHRFGVDSKLCEGEPSGRKPPFLCFQRRSAGDMLVGQYKIAGSAQRRRRHAVLQHGSVLLRTSPRAPEVGGLLDLTSRPLDEEELTDQWLAHLSDALDVRWYAASIPAAISQDADLLRKNKYASTRWTRRK